MGFFSRSARTNCAASNIGGLDIVSSASASGCLGASLVGGGLAPAPMLPTIAWPPALTVTCSTVIFC